MAPFSNKTILWVITGMNILNFIDRGIIPGATNEFISFIEASHINHNEDLYLGLLQSAFIVGYAISSGIFGHMVHFYPPFKICIVGMSIWIFAVVLSGFSYYTKSYACLFIARMLSGVAESSFQCSLPPWIAKYATAEERGTWLSIFYTAIPVGTALGYAYSAALAESIGWQYAFFIEAFVMLTFFPFLLTVSPYFPSESHKPAKGKSAISHDVPSFWDELKALWSSPVYFFVVAGYAMQTGAVIGVSTFGSAFLMGLGYFDTETQSSTTFGALVSVAGVVATPLGGVLLDKLAARHMKKCDATVAEDNASLTASSKIQKEECDNQSNNSEPQEDAEGLIHAVHDPVKEQATLYAALLLITVCSVGGALFLCLDFFVYNKVLFIMVIGVGCSFIFLTYSGISIAMMLSVPVRHRAFAMGISTLCIHVFGDVPSPIIAGYIKDRLAPGCAGGSDTSGADSVATSDACRDDNKGLRVTMLILCMLLILSVVFMGLGFLTNLSWKRRDHDEDSQRIHLLQQDVFDESLDHDEEIFAREKSMEEAHMAPSKSGQVANLRRPQSITSSGSASPMRSNSLENAISLPRSPVREASKTPESPAVPSFHVGVSASAPLNQVHVISLSSDSQSVALATALEEEAEAVANLDLESGDGPVGGGVYNPIPTQEIDVVETKRKKKKGKR